MCKIEAVEPYKPDKQHKDKQNKDKIKKSSASSDVQR